MIVLLKSSFRSIKNHTFQYLGLLIILTLAISIFSAMFSNNEQLVTKYNLIYKNPLRPTHSINASELVLIDDNKAVQEKIIDQISITEFGPKWENNNSKLLVFLEKIENQFPQPNFSCYSNALLTEKFPVIDPLLCQIHYIFHINNNINNNLREKSIINWRLLLAGQKNQMHPSLIFKGRLKNDKNQEFDVLPIFDLNKTTLVNNSPVVLTKGRIPKNKKEIVISETFSYINKIKINDPFVIKGQRFIVTGIGNNYLTKTITKTIMFRGLIPELLNPKDNGIIYTAVDLLLDSRFRQKLQIDFWNKFYLTINSNFDEARKQFFHSLAEKTFIEDVDDNFIKVIPERLANNFVVQNIIFVTLTFISMLSLVLIVIFFIRKEINDQQNEIGIMKSFGYKSWQIAINFIGSIWAITTLAAILAFFCSLIFQKVFSKTMLIYNFGLRTFYFDIKIILIFFFLLPLIFTFVCWLLSILLLRMPVLTLIYRSQNKNQKIYHFNKLIRLFVSRAPFSIRLSVAFFTKSFGKWLVTGTILLLTTFILFLQYLTVDSLTYKINSYNSEWNVAGTIAYNNQYTWLEDDVTAKKELINQNYEYIAVQNQNKDYLIKDWTEFKKDLKNKDEATKRKTIYQIFNDVDNTKIIEIFKLLETIFKDNPFITNFNQIQSKLITNYPIFIDFFERFNLLKTNIEEQYKFKISAATINLFWEYQEILTKLETIVPKKYSFKKILDFISFRETLREQDIVIDNIELTINYVSYDEDQDFLLNRYDFQIPTLDKIKKLNSDFAAWIYGLDAKSFNDALNIAHKDYYYQALYFDNPQRYQQQDQLLPAVISRNFASFRNHKYKVNDIIRNVSTPFGTIDVKIVGIADNLVNEWTIITNQDLITNYFTIRNTTKNNFAENKYFNFIMSRTEQLQGFRSISLYYDQSLKSNPTSNQDLVATQHNQIPRKPFVFNEIESAKTVIKLAPDFQTISLIRLTKEGITDLLKILDDILTVIRYVTISIIAIVLILLISMIIDDSIFIISTMKILGYKLKRISALIMSWYLISTVIFFSIGIGISYLVWYIIGIQIFNFTGAIYTAHIYLESLLIIISIFTIIIFLTYFAAMMIISRKNVLSLQN